MADVFALCRGVTKSIQNKKIKFNQCQRELLGRTFSHFLDNLETALRKDHTEDDCLRMCAKALSELWRVMTYAEILVTEWGNEDWWRTVMCSSVSGSLHMHMNLLLQEFIRCLDITRIAIAEATCDQTFKLPIMDHSQFFAAIVDEAHKRDNEALLKEVEAIKESKSKTRKFLPRKFGSTYGLSKYLLRQFDTDESSTKQRHHLLDFHHVEMTDSSLGKGSLGTVFECKYFGMPAVANCLSLKALGGEESIQILEEEVELLAKLQHVNLVQFIGYTGREHQHMLIMERGQENLQAYLARNAGAKPLSHLKAFNILLQIAEAMKYLHEHDVMHGNLKASNIILNATERTKNSFWCVQVKLADYGLLRLKQRTRPSSATHSNPMSWMAPEVYDPKSESVEMYTKAMDVYSFAMIMYEMLTGCKPFEALSPKTVLPNLRAGWRPAVLPGGPGYLTAYMQRCWASNPNDRPAFSDICSMLSYSKGVILRHSFPSPLSCINEYDAEVLSLQLGVKWCIQQGAKGNLPVEVYSYATFDVLCSTSNSGVRKFSGVDEIEEVMKAGRVFGNWTSQACDLEKAFKLFKSVSHNHPEALWRLGLCYEIGMGVGVNEVKAVSLYEQARDLDFHSAFIDIGYCHATGHGVAQSFEHAKRNWTNALLHQTKMGVPLLSIQELLQKLSSGTAGCTTLDSDSVYKTMASRLQELLKHEIGRLLVNGPDSCNAPLLQMISTIQVAPSVQKSSVHLDTEKHDANYVKHVVDNPHSQPPAPPPQQEQEKQQGQQEQQQQQERQHGQQEQLEQQQQEQQEQPGQQEQVEQQQQEQQEQPGQQEQQQQQERQHGQQEQLEQQQQEQQEQPGQQERQHGQQEQLEQQQQEQPGQQEQQHQEQLEQPGQQEQQQQDQQEQPGQQEQQQQQQHEQQQQQQKEQKEQQQQQQEQRPRTVLLKGSGQGLERRSSRSPASSATLVIIAALLCLVAAIFMTYFQDTRQLSHQADIASHSGTGGIQIPAAL